MRTIYLPSLMTSALAFFSSTAQAQQTGVQVGAKAGMSLSLLDGLINGSAQFKPGLAVGAFLRWRPSNRIAIQPELVFSQQGTTVSNSYGGHAAESQIKLSYLNVPVLLKVYLGNYVNLQVGPQVGLLLSGRRTGQVGYYTNSSGSGYTIADDDVSKNYRGDVALCGGLGVDLKNGLTLSARLDYGITDINDNEADKSSRQYLGIGGLHNRGFEFALGYAFGPK